MPEFITPIPPAEQAVALRVLSGFQDKDLATRLLLIDSSGQIDRLRGCLMALGVEADDLDQLEPDDAARLAEEMRRSCDQPRRTPAEWTALAGEVILPADLAAAISTGRPELIGSVRRPFDADEGRMLLDALAVLLETNQGFQRRMSLMHARLAQVVSNAEGVATAIDDVAEFLTTGNEDLLNSNRTRAMGG